MVETANNAIRAKPQCARLSLSSIAEAALLKSGAIRLTVEVAPSNGMLQATFTPMPGGQGSRFKLGLGGLVRRDEYGKQSWCLKNSKFEERFCFCTDARPPSEQGPLA